jgi:hypothetical protein
VAFGQKIEAGRRLANDRILRPRTNTSAVFVVAKLVYERQCLKDHVRDGGYLVVDPATLTPAERAEAENNSRN